MAISVTLQIKTIVCLTIALLPSRYLNLFLNLASLEIPDQIILLICWLKVVMIFVRKSLREHNMGIEIFFCFAILLSNTFFQACQDLIDQYVVFNNTRYWVMLLHIVNCS